jgi:hypothetical protein
MKEAGNQPNKPAQRAHQTAIFVIVVVNSVQDFIKLKVFYEQEHGKPRAGL